MDEESKEERRNRLAEKRTELAHERTIMAYLRTATTIILFGIAFFGLSEYKWDFFYFAGWMSIAVGTIFIIVSFERGMTHFNEIRKITHSVERMFTRKKE
ncbi:DUF202 domain-containing protein [Candidatus Woesearchaeota archaeon]|nr:DUF202 domain-containing protein [Candidatus Woesearchaeota archaeon]